MLAHPHDIQNLNDLRDYVNETLCYQNELEIGVFRMTERILVRAGRPCGIYFCLHGPRNVKFTAIWETDRNSIFFYGSIGQRLEKIQLAQSPQISPAAPLKLANH